VTQREVLEQWWSTLDDRGRDDALEVEPGDFLSEVFALDLQLHGVHVPDVAVAFDVDGLLRRIVVHVQPLELTDFLALKRQANSAGSNAQNSFPSGSARTSH
jgi:hypothetical protein